MVSKTVVLELDWVMRGDYGLSQHEVATVLRHLLGLRHVAIEDREAVERALSICEAGADFADALHHASYRACASIATFDDWSFARRAKGVGMTPVVELLS